ncbi:hypothetical protein D9611_001464 [Ephemerocybe angulata]|uniref:Transmembrane protein n=1 Tax=Ephemerocybe angulata TaxID=980116 RepID=A0A8H5CI27_9AGAR|nr:hypothetical protein D9611_001464 [Tulosesus angulatus]
MAPGRIPLLEYPITRPFDSPWFSVVAYTVGLITIVILSVANVALVGYDPVSVFRSDFNSTERYWFDKLTPSFASRSQPGKQCDAHVFNVGDSLITNSSLFDWKVDAVYKPNAGEAGFSYRGSTLEMCDIVGLSVLTDLNTWTMNGEVMMYCGAPDAKKDLAQLSAIAKFGVSNVYPGSTVSSTLLRLPPTLTDDPRFELAAVDIGIQFYGAYLASNGTGLATYSLLAKFNTTCVEFPSGSSDQSQTVCDDSHPPIFKIIDATGIMSNRVLRPPDVLFNRNPATYELEEPLRAPILNLINLAHAAGRLDLGNPAPNNFLTNLSMMDAVLKAEYPSASTPGTTTRSLLYDAWRAQAIPDVGVQFVKLEVPGPSTLQTVFICHFSKLKSTGSFIVSVLVATLSMFSSAWGLTIVFATRVVKSRGGTEANCCRGHDQAGKLDSSQEKLGEDREGDAASLGYEDKPEEYGLPISLPSPDSKLNWEPLLHRNPGST